MLLSYTWEDDSIKQQGLNSKSDRVKRLVADVAQTDPAFASYVVPVDGDYENNTMMIDWEQEPNYYGAFKLSFPGADILTQELFFQFQGALNAGSDSRVYMAGDSCTFTGGWVESPLQSAYNAVCAVIYSNSGYQASSLLPTNPLLFNWPDYKYAVVSSDKPGKGPKR